MGLGTPGIGGSTSIRFVVCLAVGLLYCRESHAQFGKLGKRLGLRQSSPLSDQKVASGLKEALRVGTGNAVALTGRPDGYFHNEAIKIVMPAKLRTIERGLRAAGYSRQVDEFILSMNRAAERSARFAIS